MIKEIQILSEGLWESIKNDLKFFSPIQLFTKKLAELDFTEKNAPKDALLYWNKSNPRFYTSLSIHGRYKCRRIG